MFERFQGYFRPSLQPTLFLQFINSHIGDSLIRENEELPPNYFRLWEGRKQAMKGIKSSYFKRNWELAQKMLLSLHHKGVRFLMGSDTPNPDYVPGTSLIEEMILFNSIGFSNHDILKIAIKNPVELFNVSYSSEVEEAYTARLLVLDENPILDIRTLRSSFAAVINQEMIFKND